MPRHPSVLLVSVMAHVVLMTALIVLSIVAPGALPLPRAVLAWSPARTVHLDDIPLTPSRPSSARTPRPTVTTSPAPVESFPTPAPVIAPLGVGLDPGRSSASHAAGPQESPELGLNTIPGLGITDAPAPPSPAPPMRLHSGIQAPIPLVNTPPIYPELARQSRTEGLVIVEATIDEHGDVVAARVLRSLPLLERAALDAVRQWRFSPARLNGLPVSVIMTITVNFTLGR